MAGSTRTSRTAGETAGGTAPVTASEENETPRGAEEPKASSDTVLVEFVGVKPYGREFHVERKISKAQFKDLGIEADKNYSFSAKNRWRQEVPKDNADLVEYFEKTDSGFVLVERG